ncbi:hypothetical protein RSOLAG1IB_11851 [Rhizoctonia solani AG-1 IB]|uniref:mRNA export factor GLE1 n=1 Tax=Thanatephorus cucumeris (strain AG1-IB / isolate 7/3/14) TaxID=1108050 RepID=A0A0B7FIV2_THACB|nr:hypothetical protein RSOLAG1IB_11851 [Rhizoctonia solani AG-1 IB]
MVIIPAERGVWKGHTTRLIHPTFSHTFPFRPFGLSTSVSGSPSPVQGTTRRPTNAYSIHNLTDDEEESSSSSESEEAQVLKFSHAGRDTSLTLSRALTRSSPNLNSEHGVDAFLNAVRLRSRADPIEEYRNAERAAIKSANPPTPSLPHLSQALTQSHLALQAKRNAGHEEERKKAELKTEEDGKRGEEDRKKKEKEDEDRKRKEKEGKEKEEKDEAEEQARIAAQQNEDLEKASKDAQTAQAAQASQTSALKKLTRAVEENAELKSVAGRSRRKLRTRVGQVTNSQSELDKLADAIHDIVSPSSPHPAPVYTVMLSAFSKYLLLQAETEVTAKLPTAYPLARPIWLVIARGHPKLWEIFWAR